MNFYRGKLRGSRFKFLLVRLSCSDEVLDFECNNRRAELDCLGCVALIRVKFYANRFAKSLESYEYGIVVEIFIFSTSCAHI